MSELHLAASVRIVGDEHGAVLLNTRDAKVFGLNLPAAVFCTALAAGADHETASRSVIEAFDAEDSVVRRDLDDLVDELLARKLVVREVR